MSGVGVPAHGPELIFAVVRPVGTPFEGFRSALRGGLLDYGYTSYDVKLSEILSDLALQRGEPVPQKPENLRVSRLMDEGDLLCSEERLAAAVAIEAVNRIREYRGTHVSRDPSAQVSADDDIPRAAYVLDSLKRPAEVVQLREIYGDHLIVVSLQSSVETRRQVLADLIEPHGAQPQLGSTADIVDGLIERDLRESDDVFGQNMQRTFPMAEIFVNVDGDIPTQVNRLLNRLFGSPDYDQPTAAEFGMQLANLSRTRSPELGLKVGAAIVTDDLEVLSLGANTHPVPSGSPAFDSSALDIRDLVLDTVRRLSKAALSQDAVRRLKEDGNAYVAELVSGPLAEAKILDLTEFQPTVHAEMNALLDALRRGVSVDGATVYVTAFPCHTCAKHLVALGLQVRYIEPYPKSRAEAMYGTTVSDRFLPFTGIAPARYDKLFGTADDRKGPDGARMSWSAADRSQAQPKVDLLLDQRGIADREVIAVSIHATDVVPIGHDEQHGAKVSHAGMEPEPLARQDEPVVSPENGVRDDC